MNGSRSDLNILVNDLKGTTTTVTLAVAALYASDRETGCLAERGAAVEALLTALRNPGVPSKAYRITWTQLAYVSQQDTREHARAVLATRFPKLETLAVIGLVEPGNCVSFLDHALDELSSKRNFGSIIGHCERLRVSSKLEDR